MACKLAIHQVSYHPICHVSHGPLDSVHVIVLFLLTYLLHSLSLSRSYFSLYVMNNHVSRQEFYSLHIIIKSTLVGKIYKSGWVKSINRVCFPNANRQTSLEVSARKDLHGARRGGQRQRLGAAEA